MRPPRQRVADLAAALNGASVHCERHRPVQITLYRAVQQHAATLFAQARHNSVLPSSKQPMANRQ